MMPSHVRGAASPFFMFWNMYKLVYSHLKYVCVLTR
jgi:hypothetical protein